MQIRPATRDDAAVLVSLIRELAEFEKLLSEVQVTPEDIRKSLFGPRPYAEALLAEVNNEPCGFALFFHNYSTFLGRPGIYLEDLYVRPQMRGKKVGLGLLKEVARIAAERGCGRLDWSVLDWNKKAIDFYESLGAVPLSDWTGMRLTEEKIKLFAQS
jgi:GNAT superfamily N-acetyltransferase